MTTRNRTDATRPARAWVRTLARRLDDFTRTTFNTQQLDRRSAR